MKCRLAVFKNYPPLPDNVETLAPAYPPADLPVECGGAIIEHREYITHDYFNVSGFYCEKCGVRYEVLSDE